MPLGRKEDTAMSDIDVYVKALRKVDSDVLVLKKAGLATKTFYSYHHKCKICDTEWKCRASYMLDGNGCPKCKGWLKPTAPKTEEEFEDQINAKFSYVRYVSGFTGAPHPVTMYCKDCKKNFVKKARYVLKGALP